MNYEISLRKHIGQFLVTTEHLPAQWYRVRSSTNEYIQNKTTNEKKVENPITPLSVLLGMSDSDTDDLLLASGLLKYKGEKIEVLYSAWDSLRAEFKLRLELQRATNSAYLDGKHVWYIRFGKDKTKGNFTSIVDQSKAVLLDNYKFDYHFKISIYQNKLLRNIASTLIKYQLSQQRADNETNDMSNTNSDSRAKSNNRSPETNNNELSNENKPSASSDKVAQMQNKVPQSEKSELNRREFLRLFAKPKKSIQIRRNPANVHNEIVLRNYIGEFLASIEYIPVHWYRVCSSMNEYIQNKITKDMAVKNPVLPLSDLFGMKNSEADDLLLAAGLLKEKGEQFEVPEKVWVECIVKFKLNFKIRKITNKNYFTEQPIYCFQFGKDKTKSDFATVVQQIKAVLLKKYEFELPDIISYQNKLIGNITSTLMKFQISSQRNIKENKSKRTTANASDESGGKNADKHNTLGKEKATQTVETEASRNTVADVPTITTPKNSIQITDTLKYLADVNNEILLQKYIGEFLSSIEENLPVHWYRVYSSTNEHIQSNTTHEIQVKKYILPLSDLFGMRNKDLDYLLRAAGLLNQEGHDQSEVPRDVWDQFKNKFRLSFVLKKCVNKTYLSERAVYFIQFGKDKAKGSFESPVEQSKAVLLGNYKFDCQQIYSYQKALVCSITSTVLKFQISLQQNIKENNNKFTTTSTSHIGSNKKSDESLECGENLEQEKKDQQVSASSASNSNNNADPLGHLTNESTTSTTTRKSLSKITLEFAQDYIANNPLRYKAPGNGVMQVLVRIPRCSNEKSFFTAVRRSNFVDQILENMVTKKVSDEDAITWLLQVLEKKNPKAFDKYVLSKGYIAMGAKHKMDPIYAAAMWQDAKVNTKQSRIIIQHLKHYFGTNFLSKESDIRDLGDGFIAKVAYNPDVQKAIETVHMNTRRKFRNKRSAETEDENNEGKETEMEGGAKKIRLESELLEEQKDEEDFPFFL